MSGGILFDVTEPNGRTTGWYAGGGVDYMLSQSRLLDMIIGIEYEHVDLGSHLLLSSVPAFLSFTAGNAFNRNISATEDIVWGKITVKFNPWHTQ
jgi:hypothetical protein